MNTLSQKTIAITGVLDGISRSQACAMIAAAGGTVTIEVTRHTSAILVGTAPGSRLTKARALGVPEIGEADLLALCADAR